MVGGLFQVSGGNKGQLWNPKTKLTLHYFILHPKINFSWNERFKNAYAEKLEVNIGTCLSDLVSENLLNTINWNIDRINYM